MKKVLAVVCVVCVVCAAGAALAQPRSRGENRPVPPQLQKEFTGEQGHLDLRRPEQRFSSSEEFRGCPRMQQGRFEGRRHGGDKGMMFTPDMPEEIRAKAVDAEKLRIDLRAAFAKKPLDKAEILDLFAKIQKAENEVEAWKFAQRVDRFEEFQKQQELNKTVPPAPAPAEKAE